MKTRQHGLVTIAVLAAVMAAGSLPAIGSTFLKVDLEGLTRMSEAVVHGKVTGVTSYWNTDQTMIFTDVTLEVKRHLHGTTDHQVVLRVPGGTVGDYTVEMIGAPEFEMDEEVVVFLARWHDGIPMVAGYSQGKARVEPDAAGNLKLTGSVADGLPISDLARQLGRSGR